VKKILRVLLYGFLLFIVLAVLLPTLGFGGLKITGALLFGWIGFLKRVLPEISISWSGIGMVLVCSTLIVAGTHWLCDWIYAHNTNPIQENSPRWQWQWSLSLYVGLWVLFIAAMGITGFVHQLGWLLSSKEPIIIERKYRGISRMQMRETAMNLITAAEDSDWNLTATRKGFLEVSGPIAFRRRPAIEELHVLFIPGPEEKLAAAIVFPREAAERDVAGFIVIRNQAGAWEEPHPMRDFSEVLARYGSR
jgi:hypothetical protein